MYMLGADKQRITLARLDTEVVEDRATRTLAVRAAVDRRRDPVNAEALIARASRTFFEIGKKQGKTSSPKEHKGPPPVAFRDTETGLLHVVYREVVIRFRHGTSGKKRRAILKHHGLVVRRRNPFIPDQVIAYDPGRKHTGEELVEDSVSIAEEEAVVFAAPNFVSQFRRLLPPSVRSEEWHLKNKGAGGAKKGEDVDAQEAWKITLGKSSIVVAVIDDGVDIDHPNLRPRIWRNPDQNSPDKHGRDFFLPEDDIGHFDPRPKIFRDPFDDTETNDIHGTCCAGIVAAPGRNGGSVGIAPRCRVLPIKILHGNSLVPDEAFANAVRHSALHADILSCSWEGPRTPDLEQALEDAGHLGRGGKGAAIFCAAGNEDHSPVIFPAKDSNAIAVGASTDKGRLASYSNVGKQLDFVAPGGGGGGVRQIFTTDVSIPNRGYNLGDAESGGADGLHTNLFDGTSAATPLAAGVGALMLSVNPDLSRADLRDIMKSTADKIGKGYDSKGHSDRFGHGRVNAAKAVEAALGFAKAAKTAAAKTPTREVKARKDSAGNSRKKKSASKRTASKRSAKKR